MGNIAVATTVTGYFTELLPFLNNTTIQPIFTIGVIWAAVAMNITGPRFVGWLMSWSTILAAIPLTAIAVFGWFWFDKQTFLGSWNPHHDSAWTGVSESAAFALWAFMGVESAAVSANVIENPKRNVPLATLLGLLIATFLYVMTCTVLMGIIPAAELAASPAPFALAAEKAVGTALPTVPTRVFKMLKNLPKLSGPPDEKAIVRARTLLTFAQECRSSASHGGFASVRAKLLDSLGETLDHYVEEVLDHMRTGDVESMEVALAYLAVAADFNVLIRDDKAGEVVRRRAAAAAHAQDPPAA